MSECKNCEISEETIRRQKLVIAHQSDQIESYRERIGELEDTLRQMCDYAEVCKHFPGAESLERARAGD